MNALVCLLVCVFGLSSVASAADAKRSYSHSSNGKSLTPAEELQPIREAKVKVKITKTTIKAGREPGEVNYVFEEVCTKDAPVNVYDARGKDAWQIFFGNAFDCPSTFANQPITVTAAGLVLLENDTLFSDEPTGEFKRGVMFVDQSTKGGNYLNGMMSESKSRNLEAKTLIGKSTEQNNQICKIVDDGSQDVICETIVGEFFGATFEFID